MSDCIHHIIEYATKVLLVRENLCGEHEHETLTSTDSTAPRLGVEGQLRQTRLDKTDVSPRTTIRGSLQGTPKYTQGIPCSRAIS